MRSSITHRGWFRKASSILAAAVTLSLGFVSGEAAGKGHLKGPGPFQNSISLTPTITSVEFVAGKLVANGFITATVKGQTVTDTFQAPVDLNVVPQAAGICPVLDLSLAPINLDLLGLIVELVQSALASLRSRAGAFWEICSVR